ncbi:Fumarate reductase subunit D [Georgfuchsia toluolica]|uniref:Fumarate reductase subunit D n=1 Tax=Georgfuchsia toluolica TaxID=424218 RepID=A0A916J353_9PROT|nr:fumarate reductase subunit FrdD [Georgfuchsia toluolica]CAG4882534.1 Fumarate reductase subunit D [Georgfuchsia toluolica]
MAKSNKPIIWGTFAAGGTVAAFVAPILILLFLLAATGHVPPGLDYVKLHSVVAHWFGKVVTFVVIFLLLWSQAHRLRITCFDFGLRADTLVAIVFYALAGVGSIATVVYLAGI